MSHALSYICYSNRCLYKQYCLAILVLPLVQQRITQTLVSILGEYIVISHIQIHPTIIWYILSFYSACLSLLFIFHFSLGGRTCVLVYFYYFYFYFSLGCLPSFGGIVFVLFVLFRLWWMGPGIWGGSIIKYFTIIYSYSYSRNQSHEEDVSNRNMLIED